MARLHKSIYGLKQAGHDWYQCSEQFILEHDSRTKRSLAEPCLYYLFTKELQVFTLVHVDDYIIASSSELWTSKFTAAFNTKYGVNVLGTLSHFMQMSVTYGENENFLSQQRAIEELQNMYHLYNIKGNTTTPMLTELNLPDTAYTIAPEKDDGDDFIDIDVSRVRMPTSASIEKTK